MGTVQIPLIGGKYALIDEEDLPLVCGHDWRLAVNGTNQYAQAQINGHTVGMHTLILPVDPPLTPDHKDRNGLNNTRTNLRPATGQQNNWNRRKTSAAATSRFIGVTFRPKEQRWYAQIRLDGKQTHIGIFKGEIDAARAYDMVARKTRGEFALLNFPDE